MTLSDLHLLDACIYIDERENSSEKEQITDR